MGQKKTNKRAVIIMAPRDFRDEEYFITRKELEAAGVKIVSVSTDKGKALSVGGQEALVDLAAADLCVADFDAIVFVGGAGALKYLDNDVFYAIARNAIKKGKVVGAICILPAILAKAKILEGRSATVWSSQTDKSAIEILKNNGAVYSDSKTVIDGKIVTANGPAASREFAEAVLKLLFKE